MSRSRKQQSGWKASLLPCRATSISFANELDKHWANSFQPWGLLIWNEMSYCIATGFLILEYFAKPPIRLRKMLLKVQIDRPVFLWSQRIRQPQPVESQDILQHLREVVDFSRHNEWEIWNVVASCRGYKTESSECFYPRVVSKYSLRILLSQVVIVQTQIGGSEMVHWVKIFISQDLRLIWRTHIKVEEEKHPHKIIY